MVKVFAINGSPRGEKGNTAALLTPFLDGMMDAGSEVDLVYAAQLDVKPCTGEMHCWYKTPGECYIQDEMQSLYPRMAQAEILVLATPVYIPLPGEMQNVINRLCPLVVPDLVTREGRTRSRFRDSVRIGKMVLVASSGWWEKGNFGTVVRIVQELAENSGAEFAGPVLRPHASVMGRGEKLTEDGKAVLAAARRAGHSLIEEGHIAQETLDEISRPLIPQEDYRLHLNRAIS